MSGIEDQTIEALRALRALCAERDVLDDAIEAAADPIERLAHAINKARHAYSRTGYYPNFRCFASGRLVFKGDNSWDGIETYSFTVEELLAGPDPAADEYATGEVRKARRKLEEVEQHARRLREQIERAR